MKISVITPCRNAERFISETIGSVVRQSGRFEIEYLVVDGASTDGTVRICQEWVDRIDGGREKPTCSGLSMKLSSEPDQGMYDALTKGLRQASGEVIAYINADDFYQPGAFACVAGLFGHLPGLNWLSGAPSFYNVDGAIIGVDWPFFYDNQFIRLGFYNGRTLPYIQQESVFFRRRLLEEVDLQKLRSFRLAGDAFLWNSFSARAPLFSLHAVLSGYRMHGDNLAVTAAAGYAREMSAISLRRRLKAEEARYLLFLHFMWWRESKLAKEQGSRRTIPWDPGRQRWQTEGLEFSLDYRPAPTPSFGEFLACRPEGFADDYVTRHLLPEA